VRALYAKIEQPTMSTRSRQLDFVWHDMGTCVAPASVGAGKSD
jgi:hypothetical protein